MLVGEPGIGKSALLSAASVRANRTFRVLTTTGAESEADLPFAALLTLLRPVLGALSELPAVQRRALEGALALGPPAPSDRLAVHAGTLGLLTAAGRGALGAGHRRRRPLARSGLGRRAPPSSRRAGWRVTGCAACCSPSVPSKAARSI